ncbi:MAG: hypothetical protein NTZ35_01940 [Ignavibacteriales bacterium]|nr:hypothetical protein [Ignavibacteriales bacterium]
MKTHKFLTIGLAFVAVTSVRAQLPGETMDSAVVRQPASEHVLNFDRITRNYLRCLCSDNAGVIESALGHVTYMRIAYPNLDLTQIRKRVFALSMEGFTRSIRRKAFLALEVFADPSSFRNAIVSKRASGDGLFEAIARRMAP